MISKFFSFFLKKSTINDNDFSSSNFSFFPKKSIINDNDSSSSNHNQTTQPDSKKRSQSFCFPPRANDSQTTQPDSKERSQSFYFPPRANDSQTTQPDSKERSQSRGDNANGYSSGDNNTLPSRPVYPLEVEEVNKFEVNENKIIDNDDVLENHTIRDDSILLLITYRAFNLPPEIKEHMIQYPDQPFNYRHLAKLGNGQNAIVYNFNGTHVIKISNAENSAIISDLNTRNRRFVAMSPTNIQNMS